MGVLDDLKKEAEAVAAEKARETTERAAALQRVREEIAPRMEKAHQYFDELCHHLQLVNREIAASYEIRGVGRVDGLVQGQYGVAVENPEAMEKFSFRCVCGKSGVFQVNQKDAASVAAYRDYLQDNALKAKVRDTGRGSALFMVQPLVPVVVELAADYERGAVLLRVRNLTALGISRHTLRPEQIDAKLLDEIAKAILRTENRFEEMVGIAISDTTKLRLKKQIRAAMRQKQLEEELSEKTGQRERTLTGRVARTLFKRKDES